MIAAKPIGQRLDNTRAAVQRATKRLDQAHETAKLAHEALVAAETEAASLTKQLTELELEMASNAGCEPAESDPNPLASLEKQLAASLSELKSVGNIRQDVLEDA